MIGVLLLLVAVESTAPEIPEGSSRVVLMPVEEHRRFVAEASRELGLTTNALETCKEELRTLRDQLETRSPAVLDALVLPPDEPEKPEEGGWNGLEVLGLTTVVALLAAAAGVVGGVVVSK